MSPDAKPDFRSCQLGTEGTHSRRDMFTQLTDAESNKKNQSIDSSEKL